MARGNRRNREKRNAEAPKRIKQIVQCAYCASEATTRDHVPPKSFFPQPRPTKNVITVPCCEPCNVSFKAHDDYARMVFVTSSGAAGNPDRDKLKSKVKRFVERKESKNLLAGVYASMGERWRENENGLFVKRQFFTIEGEHLDAFARRMIRALFLHQKGYKLPDDCLIHTFHRLRLAHLPLEAQEFLINMAALLSSRPIYSCGEAFAYQWEQSPNGESMTWWLLTFYGQANFICNTFPRPSQLNP
jgi:hypothetical protein